MYNKQKLAIKLVFETTSSIYAKTYMH